MAAKIIVLGGLNGVLRSTFDKISRLQAKTPFAFAVIAGDFFADPQKATADDKAAVAALLDRSIQVPLPTYFTVGRHALPQEVTERLDASDGELCPNLFYLGKRSLTKTSEGIRIVALGGVLDPNITAGLSHDKYLPFHTEGDAKALYGNNTADILVTASWPVGIRNGSKITIADEISDPPSEQCIADLDATLKPRYHFSASSDLFYEREPFSHPSTEAESGASKITRFLSLASPSSSTKAKWLYAFSLDPKAAPATALPAGTTASPFHNLLKRARTSQGEAYGRFAGRGTSHTSRGHHKRHQREREPDCFFCLSSPNVSTHLITSIGVDAYLTTARGPLTQATTFAPFKTPLHILLIPLAHAPISGAIADEAARSATYAELTRYRKALQNMVAKVGLGRYGAVTWEVSRRQGVHFHWQFLPLPADVVKRGLAEAAFRVEADNEKYPAFQARDIRDGSGEGQYFRLWIWRPSEPAQSSSEPSQDATDTSEAAQDSAKSGLDNGAAAANTAVPASTSPTNETVDDGIETQLVMPLGSEVRFDMQFGRRVLGKLLRLDDTRLDWRACAQDEATETAEAEAFKEVFQPYDFSLE